jgi:hypothetical protein
VRHPEERQRRIEAALQALVNGSFSEAQRSARRWIALALDAADQAVPSMSEAEAYDWLEAVHNGFLVVEDAAREAHRLLGETVFVDADVAAARETLEAALAELGRGRKPEERELLDRVAEAIARAERAEAAARAFAKTLRDLDREREITIEGIPRVEAVFAAHPGWEDK